MSTKKPPFGRPLLSPVVGLCLKLTVDLAQHLAGPRLRLGRREEPHERRRAFPPVSCSLNGYLLVLYGRVTKPDPAASTRMSGAVLFSRSTSLRCGSARALICTGCPALRCPHARLSLHFVEDQPSRRHDWKRAPPSAP